MPFSRNKIIFLAFGVALISLSLFSLWRTTQNHTFKPKQSQKQIAPYAWHHNITATVFWIGEKATSANAHIPNSQSAWDDQWKEHFGGFDDPTNRYGNHPAGFTPKENPFYIALPYDDFNDEGQRKSSAAEVIPWASSKQWSLTESMVKNQWVEIQKSGKTVYAQWEDVGPFQTNDTAYVFGQDEPVSEKNENAGIDVSPAVRDFLGMDDIDTVAWRFVLVDDVPAGPWKEIITTTQVQWD